MIAAKHFDIVMGVDVHIILIPTPGGPVPTPIPHPFVGMMFDPNDYDMKAMAMSAASSMGIDLTPVLEIKAVIDGISEEMDKFNPAKRINQLIEDAKSFAKSQLGINPPPSGPAHVNVNGLPRSIITSKGIAAPPHIPIGGPFQKPPDNECEAFLGSLTVRADQEHMCFLGCMTQSCQDIPPFPNSVIMAIPGGPPVLVGGPPVPSLNQMMLKAFNRAMSAIKNSKFVKGISNRIQGAAKKGMDKLGIPADSFVRNMVHDQICEVTGHPVVIATGKVFTSRTDFKLPGPIPFKLRRKWSSTSVYNGPFGKGWHWKYDLAMAIEDDAIVVRMADGRPVIFPSLIEGESFSNIHEKLILKRNGNKYVMIDNKQFQYHFASSSLIEFEDQDQIYPLTSVQNPNGFLIQFHYDKKQRLKKIIDSCHRELPITTDSMGRIFKIEGPHPDKEGQLISLASYEYDEFGNCIIVKDSLGQSFTYEYDNSLLIKETDRNGLSFHFEYDKEDSTARCTRTWGDGGILNHKLEYNLDEKFTKVTTSLGHTYKYYWDDKGLVWKKINAKGDISYQRFNEKSQLIQKIDELGQSTTYTYDAFGNRIEIEFPDGSKIQRKFEGSQVTSLIDQNEGVWTWNYDDKFRLISMVNCDGFQTSYGYKNGHLREIERATQGSIQFEFDENNCLKKLIYPNQAVYFRKFDRLGRVVEIVSPNGNIRSRKYDLLGRLIEFVGPMGNKTSYSYDPEGNIVCIQDDLRKIDFQIIQLNRIHKRVEGGREIEFSYDTEGNLIELKNEHGNKYRFRYDENMQIIEEVGFDGVTRKYKRDKLGRIRETERANGEFTIYEYDKMGRVVEILYSNGEMESFSYRQDGKLREAVNNHSKVVFERNGLGKITKEIQGEFEILSEYNGLGHRTGLKSSLGAEVNFIRDNMGGLQSVSAHFDEIEWGAMYERNEFGKEIHCELSGGLNFSWERDKIGRPLKYTLTNSVGTNELEIWYSWDSHNRIFQLEDTKRGKTLYNHDVFGYLTSAIYSDGERDLRIFNEVGNPFQREDKIDRTYGLAGQLLYLGGTSYSYDKEGNLIRKEAPDGNVWEYYWDAKNRLKEVKLPNDEKVYFLYDPLGRRIAKYYMNTLTRWVWDKNKIVHEWKEDWENTDEGIFSKVFENPFIKISEIGESLMEEAMTGQGVANEEILITDPSLNSLKNSPDSSEIITWIQNPKRFSPLAVLTKKGHSSIISNHMGTPLAMYDQQGEKIWDAELSIYGSVRTSEKKKQDCPFRFPGQYEDEETGLYYNRFRYYDPEGGIYISQDPIRLLGGLKFYSYVGDPNSWIDPFGLQMEPHECLALDDEELDEEIKRSLEELNDQGYTFSQEHIHRSVVRQKLQELEDDGVIGGDPVIADDSGRLLGGHHKAVAYTMVGEPIDPEDGEGRMGEAFIDDHREMRVIE